MRTSTIYRVSVSYAQASNMPFQPTERFSYFSNLQLTIDAVGITLLAKNWDTKGFNYTAVYRSIKSRGRFVAEFKAQGVRYLKISIEPVQLNPPATALGIDAKPS